jgi:putative tryptophan/tyrosine transport system substrate-binding protein
LNRRDFISLLSGVPAWPVVARAEQPAMPIVSFVNPRSAEDAALAAAAFREGLNETGYAEGQSIVVE